MVFQAASFACTTASPTALAPAVPVARASARSRSGPGLFALAARGRDGLEGSCVGHSDEA